MVSYLALLLSHAREEAYDHLRDDTLARLEVRNPVEIEPVAGKCALAQDE